MRDLQDIAKINGPDRAVESVARYADIALNSSSKDTVREQQIKHGERIAARRAANGR